MKDQEIVQFVKSRLNEEGKKWGLVFEVGDVLLQDGAWTQVLIRSNASKKNSAAEQQIIADIEEEATEQSHKELLLLPVKEFHAA